MATNPLGQLELGLQLLLSYALGTAAGPALSPLVRALANEAWSLHPDMPPDAVLLAQGVAQGQVDPGAAANWATQTGFGAAQFKALVDIANTGPPLGSALMLLRRGVWTPAQYQTALNRQGIEPQWWAGMTSLQHDRLDLGAIATAVHRGIMSDSGLLVTPVPSGSGKVPRIPQSNLDTIAEFAAQGIDPERARVLVADTGLPLSLGEMLQLYNRGEVTATDVKVSIAESNVRNEYMDVALNLARRLLTPHEYAEAELRGQVADGSVGAALSGLDPADYKILFGILGRPLNIHQVTTGLARGGRYNANATDYSAVPAGPYRDAIRRSAIRPEYAELDYANRYTYPSGFQIKSEAADLGEAQTEQLLLEVGWDPKWAKLFATKWSGGAGPTADKHVAKAQTQLWSATHKGYLTGELSDASATSALEAAGVVAASAPAVLALWRQERDLIRKSLSAAQIKKAWVEQVPDPALGRPWSQQEAVQRLQELGYSADDAVIFLDS